MQKKEHTHKRKTKIQKKKSGLQVPEIGLSEVERSKSKRSAEIKREREREKGKMAICVESHSAVERIMGVRDILLGATSSILKSSQTSLSLTLGIPCEALRKPQKPQLVWIPFAKVRIRDSIIQGSWESEKYPKAHSQTWLLEFLWCIYTNIHVSFAGCNKQLYFIL